MLGAGAVAACTKYDEEHVQARLAQERIPWYDNPPVQQGYYRQTLHGYGDGVALSPDGTTLAITLAQTPSNEIALVDLSKKAALVIADPDRRLQLSDPAFSHDGKTLALIRIFPPTYVGRAEIVLVNLDSFEARVLKSSRMAYARPSFSIDDSKLFCFGDASGEAWTASRGQPEYRDLLEWNIVAINISDGSEEFVSGRVFLGEVAIFADPRSSGVYFEASDITDGGVGLKMCINDLPGARVFRSGELGAPGQCPASSLRSKSELLQDANLSGVTRDGGILVTNGRSEPALQTFGVLVRDGKETFIAPPPPGVQRIACSWDGRVVAGVQDQTGMVFVHDVGSGAQSLFFPAAAAGGRKVLSLT